MQTNGVEESKETPKPTPTPPVGHEQSSQPPSLPSQAPQNPAGATSAASHPNLNDYYNRTSSSGYPQVSAYGNVPYPQQHYSYPGLVMFFF